MCTLHSSLSSAIGKPISVVSMNMCAAESARKLKWDNFTLVSSAFGELVSGDKVFSRV